MNTRLPLYGVEDDFCSGFMPESEILYIFDDADEERGKNIPNFAKIKSLRIMRIVERDEFGIFTLESEADKRFNLRDEEEILSCFSIFKEHKIFLDITGLDYKVWVPLVKVFLENNFIFRVLYSEAIRYREDDNEYKDGRYFLSDSISGVRPLPLFARLNDVSEKKWYFVALLGFEGARFSYLLDNLEPDFRSVVPIVGAPGLNPDYTFESLKQNASLILRSSSQMAIEFVPSGCPFSLFYKLEKLSKMKRGEFFRIGLIGTRPHALGAVLFAISNRNCELIYDHPRQVKNRSFGVGKQYCYDISQFWYDQKTNII